MEQMPQQESQGRQRSLMDEFAELGSRDSVYRERRKSQVAGLAPSFTYGWPMGRSETAQRLRDVNWNCATLGPPLGWAVWLRIAAGLVLDTSTPSVLLVGPSFVVLHNDAASELLGPGWRDALGIPLEKAALQLWIQHAPMLDEVLYAEAAFSEVVNEMHHSYSPVRDESGSSRGVLWQMTGHVRQRT